MKKLFLILVVVLVLVAAGCTRSAPAPLPEVPGERAFGDTNFTNVVANDVTAADDVVVGDDLTAGGDFSVTGTSAFGGDMTLATDATGGNAGAKTEFIGLPRIKLIGGGQGTNPGSQTISLFDDTPDGEYAPIDSDVTETADTTYYKYGTKSYKAAFAATAAAGDGIVDAALGGSASWEDMESVGMLIRVSTPITGGDLALVLTDDGGDRSFDFPIVSTADVWTWVEIDISALAAGTGDVISDVSIELTTAGATNLGAFNLWIDIAYVWDAADEEALGVAIQPDGVLGVINTETGATLAELTDFIVHYESGNDYIVYITDQSAADIAVLVAY